MEIFGLKNAQDMPSAPLPMWVFCHVNLQSAHTKQLYGRIKLPLHLQSYEVLFESATGQKVSHNSSFFSLHIFMWKVWKPLYLTVKGTENRITNAIKTMSQSGHGRW